MESPTVQLFVGGVIENVAAATPPPPLLRVRDLFFL